MCFIVFAFGPNLNERSKIFFSLLFPQTPLYSVGESRTLSETPEDKICDGPEQEKTFPFGFTPF